MSAASPIPLPRAAAIAMTALGPIAMGGILAARVSDASPLVTAPAIVFGVIAATGPALYIATAATGQAPPLATVMKSFGAALAAFGVVLAGLVLPAAFLSLSSTDSVTTFWVTSAALAGAAGIALWRLWSELSRGAKGTFSTAMLFGAWSIATLGIAGRLWYDFAREVYA